MKLKVSEASGLALRYMVALATGRLGATIRDEREPGTAIEDIGVTDGHLFVYAGKRDYVPFEPDINWSQGGPLIEQYDISIRRHMSSEEFVATTNKLTAHPVKRVIFTWNKMTGPTTLIAAMRCLVASKLGDEVEVPDEFCGKKPVVVDHTIDNMVAHEGRRHSYSRGRR